jgi:Protein of unknown function (DUF3500)
MKHSQKSCPDCESTNNATPAFLRRDFLRVGLATTASLAYATLPRGSYAAPEVNANAPETLVKLLFEKLSEKQRSEICFAWDHQDPNRGLLRTRVSNNWHITPQVINSDYYTKEQQSLIRQIFEGIIQPEWHAKIDKQLKDDAGGFGNKQNIAIFGKPGEGKFELVMTGRHMTLRCDGNTTENVAFGGPLFYGHAASGFNEKPEHPGNVFWEQALAANAVYAMLDGKQRKLAEAGSKDEELVAFQGKSGKFDGISVGELSADQKALVQNTLQKLIEPYRQSDRDEVLACLQKQGGLDACHLTFYTDDDLGDDKIWDNWRLEGPAFVWHYRGSPHVHVWANIADDPTVKTNV